MDGETLLPTVQQLLPEYAEAQVLNRVWDWAIARKRMRGHIYYRVIAEEMFAFVRSYGKEIH